MALTLTERAQDVLKVMRDQQRSLVRPTSIGEVAKAARMGKTTVVYHFETLIALGLVFRFEGGHRYYANPGRAPFGTNFVELDTIRKRYIFTFGDEPMYQGLAS